MKDKEDMENTRKVGFVTKTNYGKYRLGLNMFSLGMLAYNRMELVSLVHPYLAEMAAASGLTLLSETERDPAGGMIHEKQ